MLRRDIVQQKECRGVPTGCVWNGVRLGVVDEVHWMNFPVWVCLYLVAPNRVVAQDGTDLQGPLDGLPYASHQPGQWRQGCRGDGKRNEEYTCVAHQFSTGCKDKRAGC